MKYFDRAFQKQLLQMMAETYPCTVSQTVLDDMLLLAGCEHKLAANLVYLEEKQLSYSGLQPTSDGSFLFNCKEIRITHKGLDLLADDGDVFSAILNS